MHASVCRLRFGAISVVEGVSGGDTSGKTRCVNSPILSNAQSNHIGILHASETLCEQFRFRSARFVLNPEIITRGVT